MKKDNALKDHFACKAAASFDGEEAFCIYKIPEETLAKLKSDPELMDSLQKYLSTLPVEEQPDHPFIKALGAKLDSPLIDGEYLHAVTAIDKYTGTGKRYHYFDGANASSPFGDASEEEYDFVRKFAIKEIHRVGGEVLDLPDGTPARIERDAELGWVVKAESISYREMNGMNTKITMPIDVKHYQDLDNLLKLNRIFNRVGEDKFRELLAKAREETEIKEAPRPMAKIVPLPKRQDMEQPFRVPFRMPALANS